MVRIKAGELELKIKTPFHEQEISSILMTRQMVITLSNTAIYYIPKANYQLKKFYSFTEESKDSLMFKVASKIFVIRISQKNEMQIFATLKSLDLTFLFKLKLKKYSQMKFFEKNKIIVFWDKKKVYTVDLKKVLLKKHGGYTGYRTNTSIVRMISLKSFNWGFQITFLSSDGIIRKVSGGEFGEEERE